MSSRERSEHHSESLGGEIIVAEDGATDITPKGKNAPLLARRSPEPGPAQRRGCWGTCALFSGLSLLVLTLVFAFLAVVMIVGVTGFLRDPVDNFLGVFGFEANAEPQEVDSQTIVLGIREMALLQTTSGNIQLVKTVVDTGPAPDAELSVAYIGSVTGGVDLALVGEDDIVINEDGSLTVTLPPAQLTGCYLGKPQILSRNCTHIPFLQDCGQIVQDMHDIAYDRALEELRETAYEMNMIDLAYAEAEASIYELLSQLGYATIRFERGDQELPAAESCFP